MKEHKSSKITIVTDFKVAKSLAEIFLNLNLEPIKEAPGDIYYPVNKGSRSRLLEAVGEKRYNYYLQIPGLEYIYKKEWLWVSMVKNFGRTNALAFLPPTYLLDYAPDRERLKKLVANNSAIKLIGKGNLQKRKSIAEVVGNQWETLDNKLQTVVQEIVPCAKTINNEVFNIRLYIIVRYANQKIDVFLAPNGKLIYSANTDDLITDNAVEPKAEHPHFMDEYFDQNRGISASDFWEKMTVISALIFDSIIERIAKYKFNNERLVSFMGVDVMLDRNEQIKVLELNLRPQMDASNEKDATFKQSVVSDAILHFLLNRKKTILNWIEVESWDAV
jgi:hypothetical protein